MQFRDLQKQYKELETEMNEAIRGVLENSKYISGPQVKELEQELSDYVGTKYCVTCGNGTDALAMMMMAWNVKEGDAVFVPDFTFFASGEVVSFRNATPVFYDVRQDTFNADVESLEKAIIAVKNEGKLNPRVIIAVDLFGFPADYEALQKVADKYDLLLLEDGAQGFGGMQNGKRACSFGDAATTSFFPAKPLGCYGDGGAIFTNDEGMAQYLSSIAVHGKGTYKYDNIRIGWNSRLDTLQAAILLVKLKAFKKYELDSSNIVAKKYSELLEGVVQTPRIPAGFLSSWAQYTIQLEDSKQRSELQKYLKENGIPTMIYYPKAMHWQTAFEGVKNYVECPITEKLCDTVLSLPMHPYMEEKDIQKVCMNIKKFMGV